MYIESQNININNEILIIFYFIFLCLYYLKINKLFSIYNFHLIIKFKNKLLKKGNLKIEKITKIYCNKYIIHYSIYFICKTILIK